MEDARKSAKAVRHRVEIKLSEDQKCLITLGADLAKVGVAEFVRRAAEKAAKDIISASKR